MFEPQLVSSLQEFGLSKNEAAVYVQLLQLGLTNVGPIVKQTKLHRQLVYEALERLSDRGLSAKVLRNNRQNFQATSPIEILKSLEKKEELARKVIPKLSALQATSEDRLDVKVLYGHRGFCDNLMSHVDCAARTDCTIRIIGGSMPEIFWEVVGDFQSTYFNALGEHKIKETLICHGNCTKAYKANFLRRKINRLRVRQDGLGIPMSARITKDLVSLELYSPQAVVIQIFNRTVAQGYMNHFNLMWKMCQEFKLTNSERHRIGT